MIVPRGNSFTPTCDGCGAELERAANVRDAAYIMKLWGWSIVRPENTVSEWYHFCPACKDASPLRKERRKAHG